MTIIFLTAKECADLTLAMQGQQPVHTEVTPEGILRAIRGMQKAYAESKQHEPQAESSTPEERS